MPSLPPVTPRDTSCQRRWIGALLIVVWLTYSLGALAWWAYTEPGVGVCVARTTLQSKER